MDLSRRARIVSAVGGAIALMAAGGGITYAATTSASTPTNDYSIGCSSTHHALRLINSDGSCPAGYSRINLGAASVPLSIETASSNTFSKSVTVKGVTVEALTSGGGQSSIYLSTADHSDYSVSGIAFLTGTGGNYYVVYNGAPHAGVSGPNQIDYTQDGTDGMSEIVDTAGVVTADVMVVHNGHTFTITIHEDQNSGLCNIDAQVTQST